jgi:hypothetical protein
MPRGVAVVLLFFTALAGAGEALAARTRSAEMAPPTVEGPLYKGVGGGRSERLIVLSSQRPDLTYGSFSFFPLMYTNSVRSSQTSPGLAVTRSPPGLA